MKKFIQKSINNRMSPYNTLTIFVPPDSILKQYANKILSAFERNFWILNKTKTERIKTRSVKVLFCFIVRYFGTQYSNVCRALPPSKMSFWEVLRLFQQS